MKRVLHVMYSLERSGMETMLLSGASEWERHGYTCDVLATAPQPGPLAQAMREAGYGVVHLPLRSGSFHYLPSASLLQGAVSLFRQYDVVHIHVEGGATLYALLAKLAGVPCIARSIHNTFLFEGTLRVRKRWTRRLGRLIGVRFGMVSDSVMRCEAERFGNTGVRTWNWLDVNYFRPPTDGERREARAELGVVEGRLAVVSVGNCNAVKNHGALLEALAALRGQVDAQYFHVGREQAELPELAVAGALGLGDVARFEGSQADPRKYFWAADAYVMPSLYEGLGVAALEAIASGAPAVLSDVSGLCEILEQTQHCVSVRPVPASVGEGLVAMAARPPDQRRVGALEDSARIRELYSAARGVGIMVEELYACGAVGDRALVEAGTPMKLALCAPVDLHALARFYGRDTADVPPGLGSTATTPLIVELLKRGHEVTLFTLSNELPQEVSFAWGKLRVHVARSRRFGSARNFFYPEIAALRRLIKQEQPAFVHAHWTYEFALGALASGVPTVATIHDLPWSVLGSFRDRFRTIRLLMAYAVAGWCRRYTAVSKDAARHFSRYMRPGAVIETIPNFVEARILALGEYAARPAHEALICATVLQGWSRRKNASAALTAFKTVREARPSTRLWMFGTDFEAGGPAHRWALENGLAGGVEFLGLLRYDDLLERLHSDVDVLVHPSLDEAFSMTIVEALALQIPVVAGRFTPGVMEALDGGQAGLVVDVREAKEIAEAVSRLLEDAALRAELGRRGRARVKSLYTAEAVLPQYESLYRSMGAHAAEAEARLGSL